MYDRMNSIRLVSSGNSDPCRHMYRLHSALKQSRSSCRPVNGVGAAIFGSLVVVGSGGGGTGGGGGPGGWGGSRTSDWWGWMGNHPPPPLPFSPTTSANETQEALL